MVLEYVYSPHVDFYIDMLERSRSYTMQTFHVHYKYEIYYQISGTRRYFIEDSAFTVNAGSAVLVGANQIHKTGPVDNGITSRFVINFSDEYLQELKANYPGVDFTGFLSKPENHLLSTLTAREQSYVEWMMGEMNELFTDADESRKEENRLRSKMILGHLLLFLKAACERQAQKEGSGKKEKNALIEKVQNYVSVHYAEELSLNGIASEFYISPYHLSRLFKRTMNIGLIEYIKSVRTKAAQHLLETTNDSIQFVAEKAGFGTATHFRRVFKETTGLTPQKYRQYYHKSK